MSALLKRISCSKRGMISVFFERFSTFPLFLFGEGPFSWLSSKVVLVTLPDVRSSNALHTCDTRLWNQVIYSEWIIYLFIFFQSIEWIEDTCICLSFTHTPIPLVVVYVEMEYRETSACDSLNGTMHSPWLGIVIAYESLWALSLSLSNRYPLSDCLGIVTSVQSSSKRAPVR